MGKDVTIKAPVARAFSRAPSSEPPGIENIQHHCPLCDQVFGWEEFRAHAPACIKDHPQEVKRAKGEEG